MNSGIFFKVKSAQFHNESAGHRHSKIILPGHTGRKTRAKCVVEDGRREGGCDGCELSLLCFLLNLCWGG